MSNQKSIYLVAGGKDSRNNDVVYRYFFQNLANRTPNIAYVGAASSDNWLFYKMNCGLIQQGGSCNIRMVALCSKKSDIVKAKADLTSADAVFMSGGDVEAGMQILEKLDLIGFFNELYQQGQFFFGSSAGSIMLAREWVRWRNPDDDSTAELFPCLGLAPIICDTHAEKDNWMELKIALRLKGENASGYGIASGTCLKVDPDGKIEAVGGPIARYLNNGKEIEKQSDLIPVST